MMRSLWVAKTGLEGQQTSMDVISNNLANVQTNGFKWGRAVFQDLMYQTLRQPGAQVGDANQLPSGLQLGMGVQVAATQRVFSQGNMNNTGGEMDIAIRARLPAGRAARRHAGLHPRRLAAGRPERPADHCRRLCDPTAHQRARQRCR